jgi:diaminopimelate epimerase
MELEFVRADPAGNITVFVLNQLVNAAERAAAAQALLADPLLKAEQAGFAIPPAEKTPGSLWRLEMMGGEFCGNAARSFGLLIARLTGLCGRHTLMIEVSGAQRPLPVHIDTDAETAAVEIPAPRAGQEIEYNGCRFPLYQFEGIDHIIAENYEAGEQLFFSLREAYRMKMRRQQTAAKKVDALGVMFYDSEKHFLQPAVWVRATDSLIFESSCGSGSAALGVWLARELRDGTAHFEIAQSGGVIAAAVTKHGGAAQRVSIGGRVSMGEIERRSFVLKGEFKN